ncbi:MAG: hypothetical protein ACRDSE_18970 [Pseudonocardiaceae bacterium]
MPARRALILGGTGMLAGVTSWLVGDGWHVVVPSRRYSPIACDELESSGLSSPSRRPGRALWVQARWERPQHLARDADKALGGKADLLVAWIHGGYRVPVLEAVAELLTDEAPIVEVHGEAVSDRLRALPEAAIPGHPTQSVVLGYVRDHGTTRWLSHREVVSGVLTAVRRALDDRPLTENQVGDLRPARSAH